MIQRGEDLRLAPEPGEALGIEREGVGQHLQRDVAAEVRIAGAIDLAHAAGAEQRQTPRRDRAGRRTSTTWVRRLQESTLSQVRVSVLRFFFGDRLEDDVAGVLLDDRQQARVEEADLEEHEERHRRCRWPARRTRWP